jgi:hypothetical protein
MSAASLGRPIDTLAVVDNSNQNFLFLTGCETP